MLKLAKAHQSLPKKSLLFSTILASLFVMTACQNHSNMEQVNTSSTISNSMPNNSQPQAISPIQLQRYNWTLVNALDAHNQVLKPLVDIKSQVTLGFSERNNNHMANFGVGCNSMGASYRLSGKVLTINNIMSTQMLCQDIDAAERLLNELMQGSSQLKLKSGNAPILTQVTANHTTLIWQGSLTPQAKYNQKGETIFWAIKGERRSCADGFGGTKSCLQIQPVSYNEQGQKKTEGQWQLFNGIIEGYEHDEGNNQILRLTRYVVNAPHVKGKQYAYVLDQVVESELSQ